MVLKRSKSSPSDSAPSNDASPSSETATSELLPLEPTANQSVEQAESRADHVLTEFYSILQKIFSYLSAKQLNICARYVAGCQWRIQSHTSSETEENRCFLNPATD